MKLTLFLIYLFIEVYVTITIALEIGFLYTFLIIIFTVIFGLILIITTPFKMAEIMQNIFGNASFLAFGISTLLRIIAGIFLVLPGFFGDMIGLVLFIGSLLFLPRKNINANEHYDLNNYKKNEEEIIDVEIVDDNSDK